MFTLFILLTGLAGAAKLYSSTKQYESARSEYDRIIAESESYANNLQNLLESLGARVFATQKQILRAHRILEPLSRMRPRFSLRPSKPTPPLYLETLTTLADHGMTVSALAGAGTGALAAAGAWTAAGMLGTASTGTAIAGLTGQPLVHATLAWLGGGALAHGGGGMVAGKLVLAHIIGWTAAASAGIVAVVVSQKIDEDTAKLKEVNGKNADALVKVGQLVSDVTPLESRLKSETDSLVHVLDDVSAKLLPLGFLNRAWRWLRYQVKGYYYTTEEMEYVDHLASAVNRFISNFSGSHQYASQHNRDTECGSALIAADIPQTL